MNADPREPPSDLGPVLRTFKPKRLEVVAGWLLTPIFLVPGAGIILRAHLQKPEDVVPFYLFGSGSFLISLVVFGFTLGLTRRRIEVRENGLRLRSLIQTCDVRWADVEIIQLDARILQTRDMRTNYEPFIAIRTRAGTRLFVTKNHVPSVFAFARTLFEHPFAPAARWEAVGGFSMMGTTADGSHLEMVSETSWNRWLDTLKTENVSTNMPAVQVMTVPHAVTGRDEPWSRAEMILGIALTVSFVLFIGIWILFSGQGPTSESRAVDELKKAGAEVYFDEKVASKPVVRVDFEKLARTGLLSHNALGDDGLERVRPRLEALPELRHLRIGGSAGISDAGLRHLEGLTQLKTLELYGGGFKGSRITAEGVDRLRKALPGVHIQYSVSFP